jgi:hypothetical protein
MGCRSERLSSSNWNKDFFIKLLIGVGSGQQFLK